MTSLELPVRQRGQCCEVAMPVDPARARRAAELLKALADPTRLSIVLCLWKARAPVCVCDLTATFDLGQPTISHHMAKLKAAGLVESQKKGLWIYYQLRQDLDRSTVVLLEALQPDAGEARLAPTTQDPRESR